MDWHPTNVVCNKHMPWINTQDREKRQNDGWTIKVFNLISFCYNLIDFIVYLKIPSNDVTIVACCCAKVLRSMNAIITPWSSSDRNIIKASSRDCESSWLQKVQLPITWIPWSVINFWNIPNATALYKDRPVNMVALYRKSDTHTPNSLLILLPYTVVPVLP